MAYYNKFVVKGNRIDNSLAQIDVQLKRRADLIPNLIETVKGYAKHEKSIIADVTNARKALISATDLKSKVKANDNLERALKSVFAVAEAYPKLQANQNFMMLQEELSGTESKIAYARQAYNDSVLSYNNSTQMFPGNIIAGMFFLFRRFIKNDIFEPKIANIIPLPKGIFDNNILSFKFFGKE